MTSPTHDHTTPDTISTRPTVAARVEAALARLDVAARDVGPVPSTDTEHVTYSLRLARISARRAGWWRVLLVEQRRSRALPLVAERAVCIAWRRAREDYRFWCETAADWQARADARPTSDAAGALSNWAELGVTA